MTPNRQGVLLISGIVMVFVAAATSHMSSMVPFVVSLSLAVVLAATWVFIPMVCPHCGSRDLRSGALESASMTCGSCRKQAE